MQLPSHLMFVIQSSIGLSLKGHPMGIGRISSEGVSGPMEGSGGAKPGRRLFWTYGYLDLVFPNVLLYFPLSPESVSAMLAH